MSSRRLFTLGGLSLFIAVFAVLTVSRAHALTPSISITQPTYGFNVLPGSVRRMYATVTNGATNGVSWTASGGATLSASTGAWVDVTAPATGSHCAFTGTASTGWGVASASTFTVTATSQDDPAVASTITVNVCDPSVQVNVVPFYTTLYSGQSADIQSFVWGSVDRNVTWGITSEPSGGDGTLSDTGNMDTVFTATVAGRYTITATSIADPTKSNFMTVYVTGHTMPYQKTPEDTMPVDCTPDPQMTGPVYNVGPSQEYKTILSVPWTTLAPGSTVRIFNDDTTGSNPTTYHVYFQISGHATRTQPIRVCGVPDAYGNLPVIDANLSTGIPEASQYAEENYAAVSMGGSFTANWAGVYTGTWTGSQDLIVEGLKIENAKSPTSAYAGSTRTTPQGVANTAWPGFSACIRIWPSINTVVRGNDINNCDNGIVSDFNANNGYAVVDNTLYEGNHIHNNGVAGSYGEHQLYIQGWDQLTQFNVINQYQTGARGSNFKTRGFPDVIRYNYFGDGAARELDMIDNQDAWPYVSFEGYLNGGTSSRHANYPTDVYTADMLAAAVEAHHNDYVYGNTFFNTTSMVPIHYFADMCTPDSNRLGTLWFYNNSFHEGTGTLWRWFMFDTSAGGGDNCHSVEWPQIKLLNNILWMDSPSKPYFYWGLQENQFTTFYGGNVVNLNWGTNNMTLGGDGTGWSNGNINPYAFQGASTASDTIGVSNLIGVTAPPFDLNTFVPNSSFVNTGANPLAFWPKLPVRFEFGPAAVVVARTQSLTPGAMDYSIQQLSGTGIGGGNSSSTPADTTPPSAPTNLLIAGVTPSTITLSWSPSTDNVGVTGYTIYRNGTQVGASTGAIFTDTNLSPSTSYTYTVVAYDAAGNISPGASITGTTTAASVSDTTAPTASIVTPLNDATVSGMLPVTVTASDNVGVTKVELYLNGILAGTDASAPYTFSYNTAQVSDGSYSLQAKAYDAAGNAGTSPTVSIIVMNATASPAAPSQGNSGQPPSSNGGSTGGSSSGGTTTGGGGGSAGGGGYTPPPVTPAPVSPSAPTPSPLSASAPTPAPTFTSSLGYGDSGTNVELLQSLLQKLGFFPAAIAPTGYFGTITQHALLLFQGAHLLDTSGVVDGPSQALLNKVADAILGSGSTPPNSGTSTATVPSLSTASSGSMFSRYLGPGARGAEVTALQDLLFKDGDYPQDLITGFFGSLTEAAVQAFQAKYGIVNYGSITTTGYGGVGPKTREKLNSLL